MLITEAEYPGPQLKPWCVKLRRLEDAISRTSTAIAATALLCMVALNAINVVCRYLFAAPLSWSDEVLIFLMTTAVFLGTIAATRQGLHIRIDLLVTNLPNKAGKLVSALALICAIFILTVLGVSGLEVVKVLALFDQRSDALEFPVWIIQAMVPLSLLTSALLLASRLIFSAIEHTDEAKGERS